MWMPGFILDNISVLLCGLILIMAFIAKSAKSETIALLVWVVLGVVMALASEPLLNLAKASKGNGYLWWYGGWAMFDLVGIYLIYMIHKIGNISPSKLALFVSISFVILAVLQGIGYLDRAALKWKVADDFYRYMVLAVNIAIVPMAFLYVWPSFKSKVLPRLSLF